MRLAAIAATFALFGSAEAAIIQYDLTLTKSDGTVFGTGTFSYNPEITEEIQFDHDNLYCDTPRPTCETVAVWSPAAVAFDAPSDLVRFQTFPWFAEGTVLTFFKGLSQSELARNAWINFGDATDGDSFEVVFLAGFTSGTFSFAGFLDDGTFDAFSGRVDFERVGEIPLPGATWLFMAGMGALALRRRAPLIGRNRAPW